MNSCEEIPSIDEFLNIEWDTLSVFELGLCDALLEGTYVGVVEDIMAFQFSPCSGATSLHQQLEMYTQRNVEDWTGEVNLN